MNAPKYPTGEPVRIQSPSGLSIQVNANGSIRRMYYRDILLNLFLGTEIEGGPVNLYLRRHGPVLNVLPLLGPCSPAAFIVHGGGMSAEGQWDGIRFRVSLLLSRSAPAWFWHVGLENIGSDEETVDLVYAQDVALAEYGAVRINEFYISHYVDHTPLTHPERGFVLASRQNLPVGGRHPWLMIGSLGRCVGYATDALQVHGLATRAGGPPAGLTEGLPTARLQHEHAMVALQDSPVRLTPGEGVKRGFFGWFESHHPEASSAADLTSVSNACSLPEASPEEKEKLSDRGRSSPKSLFSPASLLEPDDLLEDELSRLFGEERREEEREDGTILSFFAGPNRHVVLKGKELRVLRPHAQILRTGDRLIPDEAALTSTAWMGGVFHSMLTQGHVGINRFLSTAHSYLGLFRANGQRVFAETAGRWRLLDIPSAFEMAPRECRWIYKHADGWIEVRSAAAEPHRLTLQVKVLSGPPRRFLLSNHVALNGDDGSDSVPVCFTREGEEIFVRPWPGSDLDRRFPEGGFLVAPLPGTPMEAVGGDEMLFEDGRSRNQPFLCMLTATTGSAGFVIKGRLIPRGPEAAGSAERHPPDRTSPLRLRPPVGSPLADAVRRLGEILPWFIDNALIHYLAPRGIEQYTGGGWGTRDICQGPVEMLLALGRFSPIRDLLTRVFQAQNPDGDWPQWFMFFERERNIRAGDSHGDIVFWPLAALSQYLLASGDGSFLQEEVPFFHPEGGERAERATVWGHVERALAVIDSRIIRKTRLAAYGHGDWNDSLQPLEPGMRENLCSAWTVTLHFQTLTILSKALRCVGQAERAMGFETMAGEILLDFNRLLIPDGILTGFALFREDGGTDYLLHPRDKATGLSYRLLPMIHAVINDLLTPEQARRHLEIIRLHLLAPDGARLFDRPMEYRGGPQRFFQRAESAAYFGREIGLMYTHAHLRFAEALARYGDANGFLQALCRANPIGIRSLVPNAALRQSNCYYSSSDAAFSDRYQASAHYGRVLKGEIPVEGGWRVYSSGAGIWARLLIQCLLGVRRQASLLIVDPVIPKTLDGLEVAMDLGDIKMTVTYRVAASGFGPAKAVLNDGELPFARASNPYRTGGAEIPMDAVQERLNDGENRLVVTLG